MKQYPRRLLKLRNQFVQMLWCGNLATVEEQIIRTFLKKIEEKILELIYG